MKTKYLSKEERDTGIRHLVTWITYSGMGFSFLSDTPVQLMAIHFGATNLQLGYISSILHVSGLILLIVPRLLAGHNLVIVQFWSWLVRGLVCCGYGALLFLDGQVAVGVILGVYTLFCVIRTVGAAMVAPVQQSLTTSATTGAVVVRVSNRFHVVRLISQFLSFVVLSINQLAGTLGYLVLMSLGIGRLYQELLRLLAPLVEDLPIRPGTGSDKGPCCLSDQVVISRGKSRVMTVNEVHMLVNTL